MGQTTTAPAPVTMPDWGAWGMAREAIKAERLRLERQRDEVAAQGSVGDEWVRLRLLDLGRLIAALDRALLAVEEAGPPKA